ncbi:MAG: FAD-dependent oxidoreductase [Candidatus Berkelbacteria bacterium]|nr:FAD-dependent oxidoreductase [Candidatus Berkelbacteria bacterium]
MQKTNKNKNIQISIVSPLYNEEAVIELFYIKIKEILNHFENSELVLVNDGSTDQTFAKINKLSRHDSRIKIISLVTNQGQSKAILAGIKTSRGEAIVVIDSDLQDPPNLINHMYEEYEKGAKIVMASRISRSDSRFKILTAKLFYFLLNTLTRRKFSPNFGEFYLFDRNLLPQILQYEDCHPMLRFLLPNLGLRFAEVKYKRLPRTRGESHYSILSMLRLAWQSICFSRKFKPSEPAKRVAIIGAGITGLALGYFLSKQNFQVTVYEKQDEIGGLLQISESQGVLFEKYYHHFFSSDSSLISLLDDLGLKSNIRWHKSNIAFLANKHFYDFNSPNDLISLPFLSLWAKFRFGLGYLFVKISPYRLLNLAKTASRLIIFTFGLENYSKIWHPLLAGKFGTEAEKVAASWFAARIKTRASSNSGKGEYLGYLAGSFKALLTRLEKSIRLNGGEIILNSKIEKITKKNGKFLVNKNEFDFVVSTTPTFSRNRNTKYLGVVCVVLTLSQKLTDYYWVNILDERLPFKVMVEHTNLIGAEANRHLVYLAEYLDPNSLRYSAGDNEFVTEYLATLESIFPGVSQSMISSTVFRSPIAQPVITKNFKQLKSETDIPNYFEITMAHIYPEDRGLNYGIKMAKELSQKIVDCC